MLIVGLVVLVLIAPARALAQVTGSAGPGTLSALVAELDQHNPALQAARREADASVARIRPAGTPPDPVIRAGYMGGFLRPPFWPSVSTPDGFWMLRGSQAIPYPGKLKLRSAIASTEAEQARLSAEQTHLDLVSELKTAYLEYAYMNRSLEIVGRNKQLLDQFRQIAESQFSVGKGQQQDVLKAQIEISLLLERLAVLEQRRGVLRRQINALFNRESEATLDPQLLYRAASTVPSLDELRQLAERQYPALLRDRKVIDRAEQALGLAEKERLPDFAVDLTWQRFVGAMPSMLGVEFMVNVPIYRNRRLTPLVAEAGSMLEAGRQARDATLTTATARLAELHLEATTSQQLVALYSDSVLVQARLALESSVSAYQVGTVDFLTLLTNFNTVLTYEVSLEEQRRRYEQALAQVEPLTGSQLIE